MSKPRPRRDRSEDDQPPRIVTPEMRRLLDEFGEAIKAGRKPRPGLSDEIRRAIKRCPRADDTDADADD